MRRRRQVVSLWGFIICALSLSLEASTVIYVDADAVVGANNGNSWADAFISLHEALTAAQDGDEIRVAQGIYKPDTAGLIEPRWATFQLVNGVRCQGGYAGWGEPNPNVCEPDFYPTILSGDLNDNDEIVYDVVDLEVDDPSRSDNCYHVVVAVNCGPSTILDGFTITAGHDPFGMSQAFGEEVGGGGMYNDQSSPTIVNCLFQDNYTYGYGGGISNENNSSPALIDCEFRRNASYSGGGGIANFGNSAAKLTRCRFNGNSAYWGGGMHNYDSNPILIQCLFSGNRNGYGGGAAAVSISGRGGGIFNEKSDPELINCFLGGNGCGLLGGGMYNEASSPRLTNCIFSGNKATGGGGMANFESSRPILSNCIFYGNSTSLKSSRFGGGGILNYRRYPEPPSAVSAGNCIFRANRDYHGTDAEAQYKGDFEDLRYCCIQGWTGDLGGINNIAEDPRLLDPDGFDDILGTLDDNFHLLPGSPCLDAGNNDAAPGDLYDLDGDGDFNEPIPIDFAGKSRFADDPDTVDTGNPGASGLPVIDMGAYEGSNKGFIISTRRLGIPEGQRACFSVALKEDPLEAVAVTVICRTDYPDILLVSSAMLTFNSSNYSIGQTVTLAADADADRLSGQAEISIRAAGFCPEEIEAYEAELIYVDADAVGGGTGLNWTDAYNYLQDALNDPDLGDGFEIRVAQGVYHPDGGGGQTTGDREASYQLVSGVSIKGGFAGGGAADPEKRDYELYAAILSGDLKDNDSELKFPYTDDPCRLDNSYHVVTSSGVESTAVLDGFSITAGYPIDEWAYVVGGGGGIYNYFGSPTISNCSINNNLGYAGGGMYNTGGKEYSYSWWGGSIWNVYKAMGGALPRMNNCTFADNIAHRGGAVSNYLCDPIFEDCTFSNNMARIPIGPQRSGGGICNTGSSPIFQDCDFTGNIAYANLSSGGGMSNGAAISYDSRYGSTIAEISYPVLADCRFIANSAERGGGISNSESEALITGCRFEGNSGSGIYNFCSRCFITDGKFLGNTSAEGGGIYNEQSKLTINNVIFSNNSAAGASGGGGGGILNRKSDLIITNSLFTGNFAVCKGGGLHHEGDDLTLVNCTITGNRSPWGGGISSYISPVTHGLLVNCILWDNDNSEIEGTAVEQFTITYSDVKGGMGGPGNIDVDPLFVKPGFWDPNGTPDDPNDDYWVEGDYHLQSGGWRWDMERGVWTWDEATSRCIDAGCPGSGLGEELESVPVDPMNIWGENVRVNMGAYGGTAQASMAPYGWALLADMNNDGAVNLADFAYQARDWLKTAVEQPGDLDRNGALDLADVFLLVRDWLKEAIWR